MPTKRKFTNEQLRELYGDENLSIAEVGVKLGVTAPTVVSRARELGLRKVWKKTHKICPVCKIKFKTKYVQQNYCSRKCRLKMRYRIWRNEPKYPTIQKSLHSIDKSLKRIESIINQKYISEEKRKISIRQEFCYIQERIGFIFIYLPDVAKQAGFALDGIPELIESRGGS